jgi:predicted permease
MLRTVSQDLRHSARVLRNNPGFTVIAVITLALGIGANTAIFSTVDNLLVRPLPVPHPEELVRIYNGSVAGSPVSSNISLPNYLDYRDGSTSFVGIAAYIDRLPVNVSAGKFGTERADSGMVSANYFTVLGTKAEIGRTLLPADDGPGAAPVVMLSREFWRKHFSTASIVGTQVLVDGQPFTVVGVTPAGFGGVSFENFPEIWLPLSYAVKIDPLLKTQIPLKKQSFTAFRAIARLRHGVSREKAQAQLDVLARQLGAGKIVASEGSDFRRPWPVLVNATEAARQDYAHLSFLLFGIVGMVLLIACADVSGLMLARAESRQKESAIRLALGATRARIISLHLTEGLIVALLGALVGIGLAFASIRLLVLSSPESLPLPVERVDSLLDIRVLGFAAAIAVLAGLITAILPAIKYSGLSVVEAMRGDVDRSSALSRHLSGQSTIVMLQIAASVLLLVGAGMMMRTLWHASHIPLGFDPEHSAGASTDLVRQGYDKNAAANKLDPLLDSLRAQPGVLSGALGPLPLTGFMQTVIKVEGHESAEKDWVYLTRVSPGYFSTLDIPILTGRDFGRLDNTTAPGVAVINATMAQKYWAHKSPLAKHLEQVGPHGQSFEIVGVVGDTPGYDLLEPPKPTVYLSLAQTYLMFPWQPDASLVARTSGDPKLLFSAIHAAVANVDPNLPVFHERTFEQQIATGLSEQKFLARMLLLFASVAVLLAGAGLFGLISYSTTREVHDIGVRLALGATRQRILWMVLKKALTLSSCGLALGFMAALWFNRLIVSQLFGVSRTDPLTFTGVAAFMIIITLAAAYIPARKATRVDPMVALRAE